MASAPRLVVASRRELRRLVAVVAAAAILAGCAAAEPSPRPALTPRPSVAAPSPTGDSVLPPAPEVAALLARIDEAKLREHVESFAKLGSRYAGTQGNARARRYLEEVLSALETPKVTVPAPLTPAGGPLNLAARFGPDGGSGILLAAHYDSIANRTPGWNAARDPAPGANDNGTGVAGLLEIARILVEEDRAGRLRRPVTLVFFDQEETGMEGSKAWIAARLGGGAVINLDMVGFSAPGRKKLDLMRYANSGDLPARAKAANESYGLGLQLVERDFPAALSTWVDSTPFAIAGIPAITLTESYGQVGAIDYPGYPGFHTTGDVPSAINNMAQWRAATQLVLAMTLELAR